MWEGRREGFAIHLPGPLTTSLVRDNRDSTCHWAPPAPPNSLYTGIRKFENQVRELAWAEHGQVVQR